MATDSQQPSLDPDLDEEVVDALPPIVDEELTLPTIDIRDRALPVRQGDLTRLLISQPELTDEHREQLRKFSGLLGAIFHSEFYQTLHELKERYGPLDPDSDYIRLREHTIRRTEQSDEEFLEPFEVALERANYRRLNVDIIKDAVAAPNEMGLTYVPNFNLFEHLRIYARGYTKIRRVFRSAKTKFKKRTITLDAYQRLIVALKFRPGLDDPFIRTDVLYLRMFKDVPHVDMEMHLPEQGTKVRMRWIDKAQIASPVVMGLPTLAFKLFSAFTINPMLLAPILIAPVSAGVNSFFGFQRAKAKHLSSMIRNLYYLTLANNGSVLYRLIDSAEEEEYKETMLAYFFLWRSLLRGTGEEWNQAGLDAEIEDFLKQFSGVEINFEVEDALVKLFRLGLARRDSVGRIHIVPIDQAIVVLDRLWDNMFRYS
ncbi:DUF3754 domain-containing protein [Tundrisphaera sp. TA3]|uniref:DUF3754 domain-containing protein n=1 Tax=Tundrisphaera sp. TA3 TaxID=3435775 RepID=UPI003EB6C2C8